jgi:acylphosphatase
VKTIRVTVRGRVQGVGFRNWIARRARKLELAGWVRNRSDGSVEILAAGDDQAIDRLVEAARQGPPFARVAEARGRGSAGGGARRLHTAADPLSLISEGSHRLRPGESALSP